MNEITLSVNDCAAIEQFLERRLATLEAENAKLRDDWREIIPTLRELDAYLDRGTPELQSGVRYALELALMNAALKGADDE